MQTNTLALLCCPYMVTDRDRQTGSPWERIMTPDVAGEVMEQLKWDKKALAVFRQTCNGWRDAHDQTVTRLRVTDNSQPPSVMLRTRFPRV